MKTARWVQGPNAAAAGIRAQGEGCKGRKQQLQELGRRE